MSGSMDEWRTSRTKEKEGSVGCQMDQPNKLEAKTPPSRFSARSCSEPNGPVKMITKFFWEVEKLKVTRLSSYNP